ncbi:MAG: hypothetical protein ACLPXT_12410 [Terracidiphilus sp.]
MKLTNHEGLRASGWLGLLLMELCLMGMWMGSVVHAQAFNTTTVQGTVYLANGQPGTGTLVVSWPTFTTANGQVVAAGSMTVAIAPDGFVSVNLAPNQGAAPAGLYYTAVFYMSDGSVNTQYWVVPATTSATLGQVQAQVMPAAQAVQTVSKAYVDQAIASLAGGILTITGTTMTGPLTLCCDPTTPMQAADKHYVDAVTALAVPLVGGTLTGPLTATKLGALYQVDQFTGADFGAKLGACLSGLSATQGGTCDARNFSGTLAIGSKLTISTANATVLLPCATITTANQVVVTAGTRNVTLRGCALRGASTASGSQGGTVFYYFGTGAMVQVGDPTYAADTLGFHLDNAVINITAATSASAQGLAAYRTQELDLESLYFLGNSNQTGMTLDGTGNYTGGTFYDNEFTGFQTAVNAIGHQITNPATTDWLNASTFVRLHIDCPTSGGNPTAGTYGINLQQGDGNTFTGGDVEGCATALHLGVNAQNNTIVGLRNENSINQVVADAGSSYNNWMTGGTIFTGQLTDNGTRNSFLDTFHRSFNGLNGDWYGSQKDATVTNHYRLGTGAGNERGLMNEIQTDYGYRWMYGFTDATAGEQYYQIQDLLNNVNRISVGQYNNGQSSTNNQTVINSAGTGAVVLNGSNNSGTGGVVIGSGGASETTVATINNAGNAQFNGNLQVGGTSQSTGTMTVRNNADAEVDYYLWPGLTTSQKGSFTYKDWNGTSQWYMVKDASNNWALNSATGGLDSFKAYQSSNSGDTYIDASNSTGVVRINYETGSGTQFKVYGGNSGSLYASFTGATSIQFPGLAAGSGHNCLQIDNSGYVTNTGSACGVGGGGSGTVNSGTSGQIAYYNGTGTVLSGTSTVSVTAGGTGASTASGALTNLGGEPALGNPAGNGYVLSSTTGGTRSWVAPYSLLSTVVQTNQANTYSAGLQDFSGATMKQPMTYTVGTNTITSPTTTGTLALVSSTQVNLGATQTGSGSTGTAAFPGAVSALSASFGTINNTCMADQQTGIDMGAKIAVCNAALAAQGGGIIDATGFYGTQYASAGFTLGPGVPSNTNPPAYAVTLKLGYVNLNTGGEIITSPSTHIEGKASSIFGGVILTNINANPPNNSQTAIIDMKGCNHCIVENVALSTNSPQFGYIPKTGIAISRNPNNYALAGNNTIRNVSATGYFQKAAFYAVESELLTLEHVYGYVYDSAYYTSGTYAPGAKPKNCMAISQTDALGLGLYASSTMTMGSVENSECWYYPTGVSGSAAVYFGGGTSTQDWNFRNLYLGMSDTGAYVEIQANENSTGNLNGSFIFDNVDGEPNNQSNQPTTDPAYGYYIHGSSTPSITNLYIRGSGLMAANTDFINASGVNLYDSDIQSRNYKIPGTSEVSAFGSVYTSVIKLPYQNTTITNALSSILEGGSTGCTGCGLIVSGTNTSITLQPNSSSSMTLNSPALVNPSFTGTMAGATYNSTGGYQLNGAGVLITDGSNTNIEPVVAGHSVQILNGSCAASQPASGPFNASCGLGNNNGTLLPSTLTGYHGTGAGDVKVQLSDGTGTSTHLAAFDANGGLTDGGAPSSLPGTVVQTNQANTFSTGLQDFSAATMKLPSSVTVGSNSITMPSSAGTLALTSQTITLAGDVTGAQSATTVGKINGGSVPASANALSSNSSSQLVASTSHNLSVPANCVAASGSGTAYTCSTSPTFTPATGDHIQFKADVANTGSATLAVNGATAATIKKWGGAGNLIANDMLAGHWISATFDGTYWQLEGQLGNANATQINGTAISGLSGSGSTLALTTSPSIASPTFTGTVTTPLTTAGVVTTTSGGVLGSVATTGSGSAVLATSPTFTGNTTTFANNSASTDYVVIQPGTTGTAELGGIQLNSAAATPVTEWYIEEDTSYDLKIHDQGATTPVDILTGYINAGTNINSQGTSAVTINNASSGAGTGGFIVYEGGANYNIQAFTVTSSGNASVPGTLTATGTISGGMGVSLSSATSIAATSFTSTGLALAAIPVSTTKRGMCVLIWEQNTAVGTVQFGIGMNNAPTDLWVINQDSPGAYKAPTYTTITSTTTTAVSAADAPSATATGYRDEIEFTLTTGSTNAVTVTVYGLSSSTSDALVIEPGSYCTWLP